MASNKFPGGFGPGFPPTRPFWPESAQPFPVLPPYQRTLSIPEALQITELEWNEIKKRMNHMNTAFTKLLGKSTEKPTLSKIITTWKEKRETLTIAETEVLQKFFSSLDRLQKIKNALPIGQLLQDDRIDINAILCDTTVHGTVHEEVASLVEKGVRISSRFKATVSVIPRLLDSFSSKDPRSARSTPGASSAGTHASTLAASTSPQNAQERPPPESRSRSPSPGQQEKTRVENDEPAYSTGKTSPHGQQQQEKVRRESGDKPHPYQPQQYEEEVEIPLGALLGDPDAEFQMLQMADDGWSVQRRRAYQSLFERKSAETNQLRSENHLLLASLQEKEKEIAKLKSDNARGSTSKDETSETRMTTEAQSRKTQFLEVQITNILRRVAELEAGREQNDTRTIDQLEDHLKYFRRRLDEYKPDEQTNFIYKTGNFAAGYFDDRGGFLEIEALNVSLYVPPGAIQSGHRTEVYIYVNTDDRSLSYPKDYSHVLVAPVVQCGPPGLQFQESVVLTFPHCAEDDTNWKLQPLTCQSDDHHKAKGDWKGMDVDEAICMVDNGRTVLLVNHFTFYTLGGEQKEGESVIKKKMRVGAFGSTFNTGQESYRLRVRAWDATEASHDQVLKKEERLSGQPLDDDRPISVANTGEPVDVNVNNLKAGWKNRYDEPQGQSMAFDDLWQPSCLPSCTFDLEIDETSGNNNNIKSRAKAGVHCKVDLQQREANDEAVSLRIDVCEKAEGQCGSNQTFSGAVQEKLFGPFDPKSGLSPAAYYKLCEELNMDRGVPMDWRLLADKLGCSFMTIENMKANKREEPAKMLLKVFFSLWNVTSRSKESAITFLQKTLEELGLSAAAKVIEDDIGKS